MPTVHIPHMGHNASLLYTTVYDVQLHLHQEIQDPNVAGKRQVCSSSTMKISCRDCYWMHKDWKQHALTAEPQSNCIWRRLATRNHTWLQGINLIASSTPTACLLNKSGMAWIYNSSPWVGIILCIWGHSRNSVYCRTRWAMWRQWVM